MPVYMKNHIYACIHVYMLPFFTLGSRWRSFKILFEAQWCPIALGGMASWCHGAKRHGQGALVIALWRDAGARRHGRGAVYASSCDG